MLRTRLPAALLAALTLAGCQANPAADVADGSATRPMEMVAATRPATRPAGPDLTLLESRLMGDVYWLADPERDGRGPGTPGLDEAAEFIAARFAALGLEPVGPDGYFQPFDLPLGGKVVEDKTSLTLDGQPLVLGEDYAPLAVGEPGTFEGPLAFAGYGVNAPDRGYNDFAELDLTGQVALVLRYEPRDGSGNSRFAEAGEYSRHAGLARKVRAAQDAGASAVLIVNPPDADDADALMPFGGRTGRPGITIPAFQVTPAAADRMLAAADLRPLADLQNLIDAGGEPIRLDPDAATVAGGYAVEPNSTIVRNVVGLLRGAGPRADETIVVGGHYDHLGLGGAGSREPGASTVHRGADDNASGTAAVLALAEELAGRPDRPGRSIVFVLFAAEEVGLVGSRQWVETPTLPADDGDDELHDEVVAMLNYDMVGRPDGAALVVGGETTSPAWDEILADAFDGSGLELRSMGTSLDGRSDHASFLQAGVPALFFFGSIHEDYHTPRDTPEKIDYPFLARTVALGLRVIDDLAAMSEPPAFTRPARGRSALPAGDRRVRLGVMPDMASYATTRADGVRIAGVSPDTPAERAGLREGDVITRLGETEVGDINDLTTALAELEPGGEATVAIRRGAEAVELPVTFD